MTAYNDKIYPDNTIEKLAGVKVDVLEGLNIEQLQNSKRAINIDSSLEKVSVVIEQKNTLTAIKKYIEEVIL